MPVKEWSGFEAEKSETLASRPNNNAVKVKCTYLTRDQDIGDATALETHMIGPFIVVAVNKVIVLCHGSRITRIIVGNLLLIVNDINRWRSELFAGGF
jgi:hypothetical protein